MDILLNLIHPVGQLPKGSGPFKTIGTREFWWRYPVPRNDGLVCLVQQERQRWLQEEEKASINGNVDPHGETTSCADEQQQQQQRQMCNDEDDEGDADVVLNGGGVCSNEMHKHGLLVKVWYPVSTEDNWRLSSPSPPSKRPLYAEYIRDRSAAGNEMNKVIKKMMRPMPGFLVDYYLRLRTNSILDAPIWCSSGGCDGGDANVDYVQFKDDEDDGDDEILKDRDENDSNTMEESEQRMVDSDNDQQGHATEQSSADKDGSIEDRDYCFATDKLPVVIFSHGMYGIPEFYSAYCEDLASNGYLVIAPYHTDQSAMHLIYPDGKTRIKFGKKPQASEVLMEEEFGLRQQQLWERIENVMFILDTLEKIDEIEMDWPEMKAALQKDEEQQQKKKKRKKAEDVDDQQDEAQECYRQLTERERDVLWLKNTEGALFLKGHFDSLRVGIAGHSFGACTSLASMLFEQKIDRRRLQAGISLDGWLFPLKDLQDPLVKNNPLTRPFFFINSSDWQWKENIDRMHFFLRAMNWNQRRMYELEHGQSDRGEDIRDSKQKEHNELNCGALVHSQNAVNVDESDIDMYGSIYVIDETLHQNFSDIAVMMPKFGKRLRSLGKADPGEALQQQLVLMNKFLQYHVKLEKTEALREQLRKYWFRIERHDALLQKIQAMEAAFAPESSLNSQSAENSSSKGSALDRRTKSMRYKQGAIPARVLLKVTSIGSPPSPIVTEPDNTMPIHAQEQQNEQEMVGMLNPRPLAENDL